MNQVSRNELIASSDDVHCPQLQPWQLCPTAPARVVLVLAAIFEMHLNVAENQFSFQQCSRQVNA